MFKLTLLLLSSVAQQSEPAQVYWLQTDWAPHQIVEGPFANQGTFDQINQRIQALLPQYQHHIRPTNLRRMEAQLRETTDTICISGALYSEERAATRYYSLPVAVGPGYVINYVASSAITELVDDQLHIDIQDVVKQPDLVGAYQPNRHYPAVLQQLIAESTTRLLAREFTSDLNAAALLVSERLDYVIEYPERMQFYQRTIPGWPMLRSAAIRQVPTYAISYITCNQTPMAKQLIADINQVLPQLWAADDYQSLLFYWLDENAIRLLQPTFEQLQLHITEKNRH